VKAIHIEELRTRANEARSNLGMSSIAFTDPTITPHVTPIKANHINDLRSTVK
jgi:hypothetical protein